jgi:hypothetical protein
MIRVVCHDCKTRTADATLVQNEGPMKLVCKSCGNGQRLGAKVFMTLEFDKEKTQKHQISKKLAEMLKL